MTLSDATIYAVVASLVGAIITFWKIDQSRNAGIIKELKDRVEKLEATVQVLNDHLDQKEKELTQKEIENLSLKFRLGESETKI